MANNIKLNNPLGVSAQPKKGTGFVNLDKVLNANVGNRLGETVATGLGNQAQQVQQGIGQLKTDFNQKAQVSNLATNSNKQAISDALKSISSGQQVQMGAGSKDPASAQPQGIPGRLQAAPVQLMNTGAPLVSDDQANQFKTFLSGQYSGPKDLDSTKLAQVGSKAQEVQDLGQGLQSGNDKTRLLQTFAGKGPYTAGQSKLDSLLLGQGPNAQQKLAEARQQTRGLTQQLGREQEAAQQTGQLRQNDAQQLAQETQAALSKTQGDILTPLEKQATDYQAAQDLKTQDLQNILKNLGSTIDPNEAAALGLTGNYNGPGKYTYNYQPGQDLVSPSLMTPTAQNVANDSQRAQLLALAKLAGQEAPTFADRYDPNKAVTVNTDPLKQGIENNRAQYEKQFQDILAATARKQVPSYEENDSWGTGGMKTQQEMDNERNGAYRDAQIRKLREKYGLYQDLGLGGYERYNR